MARNVYACMETRRRVVVLFKRLRGLNLKKMKARLNRRNSCFKSENAEDL